MADRWWLYNCKTYTLLDWAFTSFRHAQEAVTPAYYDEFWVVNKDSGLSCYYLFESGGDGMMICRINMHGGILL